MTDKKYVVYQYYTRPICGHGDEKDTNDVRHVCLNEETDCPDQEQNVDYLNDNYKVAERKSARLGLDTTSQLHDLIPDHYSERKRDQLLHEQAQWTKGFPDFEEFLRMAVPSKVNSNEIGWIVLAPRDFLLQEEVVILSNAYKEWKRLLETNIRVNFPLIRNLAKKHNMFSGKWMLFRQNGLHADLTWSRVAWAQKEGKLGVATRISSAKLDEFNMPINHVIHVYNDDFRDRNAVFELESKLRDIGILCRMFYKPMIFTHCDIYSNNEWGMKPYIYSSTYDVKRKQSTIVKDYDYAYDCNNDDYEDGNNDD